MWVILSGKEGDLRQEFAATYYNEIEKLHTSIHENIAKLFKKFETVGLISQKILASGCSGAFELFTRFDFLRSSAVVFFFSIFLKPASILWVHWGIR